MRERIVIALGGHALLRPGQLGTIEEQRRNLRDGLRGVAELVRRGHPVAITHGNGPQVGHMLIRAREARGKAYDLPLDVCVAQSQGETGYLIVQALKEQVKTPVVAFVTAVTVDRADPFLLKPTKPVGPALSRSEADDLLRQGLIVAEDPGRGLRRLVPSPRPKRIVGIEPIGTLFENGVVVVAAGGGGIPVVDEGSGALTGIEAVIDKDFVATELAIALRADRLLNLTAVERVKLQFRTPQERDVETLTPEQAARYLAEGQFAEGTMGPKIEGALRFLAANPRGCVDITTPEKTLEAWSGTAGTRIRKGEPP